MRPSYFVTLMCLLGPALWAQESGALAEAFERAQTSYRAQVEAATASMQLLYFERLGALKKKASEAGDYETALAYHEEAERVGRQLGPLATVPLTLTLFPEEAELGGGLSFNVDIVRSLSGWNEKSTATWKLPTIPRGGYTVHVMHRGNDQGVPVTLSEPHYFVSGELTGEQSESTLGNLRIIHDAPTLTLALHRGESVSDLEVSQIVLVSHAR